jgi:hypothetical protein
LTLDEEIKRMIMNGPLRPVIDERVLECFKNGGGVANLQA